MDIGLTWILVTSVTCLVLVLATVTSRRRDDSLSDPATPLPLPPGSLGLPVIGETFQFITQGARFYVDRFKRYGRIYKTHLLGAPTVRVSGADLLRVLFSAEPQGLSMKIPASARKLFGDSSILNTTNGEHAKVKKQLLEAFTTTRLRDYLPCIQHQVRSHMLSWCGQGRMLGFPACERLVGDIILELVLGCRRENDQDGQVRNAIITINNNLICAPIKFPGGGFSKANKARETVADFVMRRLREKTDKDHVSMLEVFQTGHSGKHDESDTRRSGKALTPEEILDNSISMLIAGTGTTSGALCGLLMVLGQHPEVMDELREELTAAGLMSSDNPSDLTFDLLQGLEFTHCIVKESLRLHSPAGGAFRQAENTLEIAGYQIPKKWTVVYSIRDTHNNSRVFSDVSQFKPSRWRGSHLTDRLHQECPYNYIPFGHGPRACIGKPLAVLQMTVFLVELARLLNFQLHNPHPPMVFLPVTKPSDDLPVTFKFR